MYFLPQFKKIGSRQKKKFKCDNDIVVIFKESLLAVRDTYWNIHSLNDKRSWTCFKMIQDKDGEVGGDIVERTFPNYWNRIMGIWSFIILFSLFFYVRKFI